MVGECLRACSARDVNMAEIETQGKVEGRTERDNDKQRFIGEH